MVKQEIIVGILALATSVIGFGIGKRQQKANAQKTELDSVDKAVAIWRQLAQDFKIEVDELRKEVSNLREENHNLREEINILKGILSDNGIERH